MDRNSRIYKVVPPGVLCIADGAAVYIGKDLRDTIQDIAPKVFDNQYKNVSADDKAYVIYACGDKVFLKVENGKISVPKLCELSGRAFQSIYLFSVDGQPVFMPYIQSKEMGSGEIMLDGMELSEAEWVARSNMKMEDDGISLTYEMMDYFKNRKEAFCL